MFFCYLPFSCSELYNNANFKKYDTNPRNAQVANNVLQALNCLYGVFLTILFYTKTKGAREEWLKLIYNNPTIEDETKREVSMKAVSMNPIRNVDTNRIGNDNNL